MGGAVTVKIPRVDVKRLRLEAEGRGVAVEEYLSELLTLDLGPRNKA